MNRIAWAAACIALLGAAGIGARAADLEETAPAPAVILSTEISGSDLGFLMQAAPQGGLLLQMAGLAKNRATIPQVQSEAGLLFTEQTAAAAQLKTIAAHLHAPFNSDPDTEGTRLLDALRKALGMKFDKMFLDDERELLDRLEPIYKAASGSGESAIRNFAVNELALLTRERQRIKMLGL